MISRTTLLRKARRIKMVLIDVDGVMTDGGLYYTGEGNEMKRFHAHDGYGVVRAREHGLKIGIISGRSTPIVTARARVLKIDDVYQDRMDKVNAMREVQERYGFRDEEFAFIGDDLFDLPLLAIVGLSAAPGNALPQVRRAVHYVAKQSGGNGAVREVLDLILDSQTKR
jgi:3-deoxy-D-manno-octulosonate 8-phosphate phosphatase (KDO 8-P phosphatase)